MGETCDICGRERKDCGVADATPGMGHALADEAECYRIGFERLRKLYRGWQDEIDNVRASPPTPEEK